MNLLNLFISANSFLNYLSLGFSLCKIMAFANRNNFTSCFPSWFPFLYFSCLIALARVFNTVFNRSGKNGYTFLAPDFRGKTFTFSPLSMLTVTWFYICSFYCVEVISIWNFPKAYIGLLDGVSFFKKSLKRSVLWRSG